MNMENGQKVEVIYGEISGQKGVIQNKSKIGSGYYNVILEESGIIAPFYKDELMTID